MRKVLGKFALAALLSIIPVSTGFAYSISYLYATATDGSGKTTIESGVTVLDFNLGDINSLVPSGPVASFEHTGTTQLVTGSPPFISDAPGDDDLSQYLSVHYGGTTGNLDSFTINLKNNQNNYFGMYWGSIDTYNTLKFFNDGNLVETITGSAVTNDPQGNWINDLDNRYVSFYGLKAFDKVILESNQAAFEVDNVAFGTPVPEPATLLLFGAGLLGLAGFGRRKMK